MYTSTISLRRVNTLFQEIEWSRSSDADLAIQSVPELRALKWKIPEEQLYARARAIAKMDAAIKDPSAAFGKAKVFLRWPSANEIVQNLRDIRSTLVTELTSQTIAAKTVNTYFQWWDAPGDSNFGTFRQNMTFRVFLQRFLSDSEIVTDIFHVRGQVSTPENPEVVHKVSRCKRFILALEARNPDAEYKPMFRRAMAALSNNDIRWARTILEETLKDEWNIDFDVVIASEEGMSRSLRAIWDTQGAAKAMAQEWAKNLKESKDLSPKQKALLSMINREFEAKKAAKMATSQTLYSQIIEALPTNDPQRIKLHSQKSGMIDELASEQAYMGIMDNFIKENGSDWLWKMFQDYDEMRWLYGPLNFTDENAKMATETAIMLGSFVLTAGLGPILAGIAAWSRALAGSRLLAAAQVSEKASRARKTANSVGNAAKAGARTSLEVVAKGATAGVVADKAVESSKRAQALWQAAKFTTADALLRSITRSEGEKSSWEFDVFFKNLATNAVMFKAFAAVEGFLNVQVLNRIKGKFGLQNNAKTYMLADFPVLTAGDIAVMQAMHAAETGNLEFDMLWALQGMAFRIGFRGTESLIKTFPNLAEKFKAKYGDLRERVRLNKPVEGLVPEGTYHAGDDMAHGARPEPAGKNVAKVPSPDKKSERVKNEEFVPLKDLNLDTLNRGTTLSFSHPGSTMYSPGEVVLKMLGNGQARVVSLPKSDRQSTMDYGLKTGDTVTLSLTRDGQHQFLNLDHPKNGSTSLIMNDINVVRIQNPISKTQKPTDWVVVKNTTEMPNYFREQAANQPLRLEWNGKAESGFSPDITPEFFRGVRELVGKPHADFLSSIHNTLNRWQFPQFPWRDGFIWTIRKIESGPNGREKVTVWKLGSMEEVIITAKELKYVINTSIRKYAEWERSNRKSADVISPSEWRPKKNQVTDAFIETQVLQNNQERFLGRIRAGIKEWSYMEFPGPDGFIWTIRSIWRGLDPILTVWKKGNKTVQDVKASNLRKAINDQIKIYREYARGVAVLDVVDVSWVTSQPKPETPPIYDANGRKIDVGAQARIDAEHGIGRDTKSATDSAQVFDAATMWPPTHETVMGQNLEQSIAKTRKDINTMKADLDAMVWNLIPDAIIKKRADIARAEKHLASLEQSARELTPLRQSRREMQEHLRAERQKLIDMTPEARAAELARVQTEGKKLIEQKIKIDALEQDNNTTKMRRKYNKVELASNKRQENMMKRADTIASKLREQWLNPAATAAALSDPKKRNALGDWLDNLKKNDKVKWALIAAAVIALALLLWPKSKTDSTEEDTVVIPDPSVPMSQQLDDICAEDSWKPLAVIEIGRDNWNGIKLSEKRRESISQRWMKNNQWKALIDEFESSRNLLDSSPSGKQFIYNFDAMIKDPTIVLVQDIQRWIGMESADSKVGQDGILGPITTQTIHTFIQTCKNTGSVPVQPVSRDIADDNSTVTPSPAP